MKTGVLFPTSEIGTDSVAVRDYAQAAEALGYDHMLFFEHVIGANAESPLGRDKPWSHTTMYHEPFTLFGYLAAATTSIELATCIMVLPLRETALVAKQAAAVDVLSGGRLRLGVGVGLNKTEYEAMGKGLGDRGARIEEQIELLRLLWTNELVTFEGRWHRVTDAGINPLPVQRPIPIWIGGSADRVVRRIGRLADEAGVDMAQYVLAWTLAQEAMTSLVVGAKRIEQVAEALKALEIRIPPEHFEKVDEICPPPWTQPDPIRG